MIARSPTPPTRPGSLLAPVRLRCCLHCARGAQVGIFFGAVVRGDLNKIRIGHGSVVLDRSVIHAARQVTAASRCC